jgi:dTMP kinase
MGRLIAIEGIDGSGKGTQAARLREGLERAGTSVALLSFPRYEATLFGRAIGDYLNGRFGSLDGVSPFLASLLFAGDRFESRELLHEAIAEHDVVVLDRYVASNVAHQGAKLTGDERGELVEWILRVEHEVFGLPRADLVLLLDLPVEAARRQVARKAARSYTEREADLHEADAAYLSNVRESYRELAAADPNWTTIDCTRGDGVRSIDDVAAEILAVVQERMTPHTA